MTSLCVIAVSLLVPRHLRDPLLAIATAMAVYFGTCPRIAAAAVLVAVPVYLISGAIPGSGTVVVLGVVALAEAWRALVLGPRLGFFLRARSRGEVLIEGVVGDGVVETAAGPVRFDVRAVGAGTPVVLVGRLEEPIGGAAYRASAEPPTLRSARVFLGPSIAEVRLEITTALALAVTTAAVAATGACLQLFAGA